ncbi:S8 family peptidase [Mechercharimyces sp. CAU 1602]|uniref:S8 family peptidase n=1 Tax=Mechercharimyces sp. CAU 1602 TaxID=2973933 RepID=UPI002162CDC7|nr:S8 family peptidase [Mechercharimyces sp. CAU 1602]MCS1352535.1 S8 family peptidase [Mechercharimyces sp. CAU 1602]
MKGTKQAFSIFAAVGLAVTLPLSNNLPAVGLDTASAETKSSDEIVVKFSDKTSEKVRKSIHRAEKSNVLEQNESLDFDVVEVEGQSVEEAIAEYSDMENVEYAEPIIEYKASWTPDDPMYESDQYGPQNMSVPEVWDTTKGSSDTVVAVIDTGVQSDHPDLSGKVIEGYDFVDDDNDASDEQGHGTHVAGTIGAATNNGIGVAGVAPEVQIMPVRVLDANGSGTNESVANGITYAADNGAQVINLSLGGPQSSQVIEDAVEYAVSKGVLVVAAAGNESTSSPSYPAYYEGALSVAAVDANDTIADFSNYGDWVDVAAPGVDIISTELNGEYVKYSGTSMASPHVAGVAALLSSQGMAADEIRDSIQSSADQIDGTGDKWTYGRVNAAKAIGSDNGGDNGNGEEEETTQDDDNMSWYDWFYEWLNR